VSVKEYLDGIMAEKFKTYEEKLETIRATLGAMDKALVWAKQSVDEKMQGFPMEYVRKGDSDVAITELRAKVELVNSLVTKFDMRSVLPRGEYEIHHNDLEEKTVELRKDLQKVDTTVANMNGRILGTAAAVLAGSAVIQILMHIYLGK